MKDLFIRAASGALYVALLLGSLFWSELAFLAVVFLAGAFLAGAFFAGAFLAGVDFFAFAGIFLLQFINKQRQKPIRTVLKLQNYHKLNFKYYQLISNNF